MHTHAHTHTHTVTRISWRDIKCYALWNNKKMCLLQVNEIAGFFFKYSHSNFVSKSTMIHCDLYHIQRLMRRYVTSQSRRRFRGECRARCVEYPKCSRASARQRKPPAGAGDHHVPGVKKCGVHATRCTCRAPVGIFASRVPSRLSAPSSDRGRCNFGDSDFRDAAGVPFSPRLRV